MVLFAMIVARLRREGGAEAIRVGTVSDSAALLLKPTVPAAGSSAGAVWFFSR